ncbi:hypothetical protein PHYPSEUDO_005304 [Phytophthora pseudosyringae]|uniref:Uncharacterized protein n=1 Tax=Phytophthora pseudosyringae TaxID=221518 RepID=A0A8T1VPZ2_9STRA|nr:hypothetical protein PHYPSEUDO_005304 [Phytophthora pseudosyringae]
METMLRNQAAMRYGATKSNNGFQCSQFMRPLRHRRCGLRSASDTLACLRMQKGRSTGKSPPKPRLCRWQRLRHRGRRRPREAASSLESCCEDIRTLASSASENTSPLRSPLDNWSHLGPPKPGVAVAHASEYLPGSEHALRRGAPLLLICPEQGATIAAAYCAKKPSGGKLRRNGARAGASKFCVASRGSSCGAHPASGDGFAPYLRPVKPGVASRLADSARLALRLAVRAAGASALQKYSFRGRPHSENGNLDSKWPGGALPQRLALVAASGGAQRGSATSSFPRTPAPAVAPLPSFGTWF